ncbi:MAG: GntR family transcriptional regulator [Negativicutes bacterium]|nr:GntR family transcriptional regulator [Negativicutes bacterium]
MQIKEDLESKINDGDLKPGDKLPSEPELARAFDVSRPTLREALKMLQREGMLISKNGVGTYINNKTPLIENSLNRLRSLGEMINNAGYQESELDVKIYTSDAEQEWKDQLLIDEKVVVIERIRTANGEPIAFYYNIFPQSIAGTNFREHFSGAIFKFLESGMSIKIKYSITEICAVSDARDRDRRAVEILGPEIVLLKQLHFAEDNSPVFYSLDYLRSDVIKLVLRREREIY